MERKYKTLIYLVVSVLILFIVISSIIFIHVKNNNYQELAEIKEIFKEITEIHKIKYNNTILGYNWYIKDGKEYYEIIHDYAPNDGGYISIYTTIYIKTDTGNIYEISNERN